MTNNVRVRFAPSPTGSLHIGNLRAAIFNWLLARHHKGKFLVRIEDTDIERSKKEYVDVISNSLKWLDMMPDEEILYQSSRQEEHKKLLNELLEKGLVYPCFCEPKKSEEKVFNLSQGVAEKYNGTCRNKKWTKEDLEKPHALRFKLPEDRKNVLFNDLIRGEISVGLDQLDDFVVMRRDGTPIYNFVVVVDDIFMKISHIVRGEDHISNTPKQVLLYEVLNAKVPEFAHLPLILGPSGNKLSKRDAAVSVSEYEQMGILPDALFNYLVRLGWSHGDQEIFSRNELVEYFDLDHVGKKGAIFDIKKLKWLNGIYIRKLNKSDFLMQIKRICEKKYYSLTQSQKDPRLDILFELYRERATTLVDLADSIIAFAKAPDTLDTSLISKWLSPQTPELLREFITSFEELGELSHDKLLQEARQICEKSGVKLVTLAQPLRLALTGSTCSPGVFELIALLEKDEVIKRVNYLIEQLK
jgi:glutamyl-tRNA synthetase